MTRHFQKPSAHTAALRGESVATKLSNLPEISDIAEQLARSSALAIKTALDDLAAHGVVVGAVVELVGRHTRPGRYRIVSIYPWLTSFGAPVLRMSIKGVKQRRDGSWGEYAHSLGGADDVTVILPASPPMRVTE